MKAKEYNALMDKLDMRPRSPEAADMLGICTRSTYLYSNGYREIPPPVAKLLRLIVLCHKKGVHTLPDKHAA